MPRELFLSTVDLDLLYPPFLEKLLRVKAACKARGKSYLTTEGFRSFGRSFQLHKDYLNGRGVRAAPAGMSGHNYGLCTDEGLIVVPSPNRMLSWDIPAFDVLKEELAKEGLLSGGVYGDHPHVDFPGFVSAKELAPLRALWVNSTDLDLKARLRKIWDYVDSATTKKVSP